MSRRLTVLERIPIGEMMASDHRKRFYIFGANGFVLVAVIFFCLVRYSRATEPNKVRDRYNKAARDRREKFNKLQRKQREEFSRGEKSDRESFLKKLKAENARSS